MGLANTPLFTWMSAFVKLSLLIWQLFTLSSAQRSSISKCGVRDRSELCVEMTIRTCERHNHWVSYIQRSYQRSYLWHISDTFMANANWKDLSLHGTSIYMQIGTADSCSWHLDDHICLVDDGWHRHIQNRDIEWLSLPNNGSHCFIQ